MNFDALYKALGIGVVIGAILVYAGVVREPIFWFSFMVIGFALNLYYWRDLKRQFWEIPFSLRLIVVGVYAFFILLAIVVLVSVALTDSWSALSPF